MVTRPILAFVKVCMIGGLNSFWPGQIFARNKIPVCKNHTIFLSHTFFFRVNNFPIIEHGSKDIKNKRNNFESSILSRALCFFPHFITVLVSS